MRVLLGIMYTILVVAFTTLTSGCVAEAVRRSSWWVLLIYMLLFPFILRPLDFLFHFLYVPYAWILRSPWHNILYAIMYLTAFVAATFWIWVLMWKDEGHWILGGIIGTLAAIALIFMKAMYLFAGLDEYYKRNGL